MVYIESPALKQLGLSKPNLQLVISSAAELLLYLCYDLTNLQLVISSSAELLLYLFYDLTCNSSIFLFHVIKSFYSHLWFISCYTIGVTR